MKGDLQRISAACLVAAFTLFCLSSLPAGAKETSISDDAFKVEAAPDSVRSSDKSNKPDGVKTTQQIFLYHTTLVASGVLYGNSPLGWEKPTVERWENNVSQPPAYPDRDGFLINYVGHPVMGAHMFIFARQQGYDFARSAGASTLGSFLWEYGFEGPFERPSMSDLLVTSTVGSVIGEAAYRLYRRIDRSSAGSKWYGKVVKTLIYPFYIF